MSVKIEGCFSEFVGTFFLVLTIGYNVLQRTALAPISIGAMLTAMIFATGKVSGGHFNPAVTLGVFLRGKVGSANAAAYVGSQLCGGFLAAFVYMEALGATFTLGPGLGYTLTAAFVVELLFSTALVFVVLSVSTTAQDFGNWYYGLAIGFTVMAAAFAIAPISGCSLNPAVTIGVMLTHFMRTGEILISRLLIYTVAPLLGAMLAVLLFKVVRNAEFVVFLPTHEKDTRYIEYIAESLEPQNFPTFMTSATAPIFRTSSPRTESPRMESASYQHQTPGNTILMTG